MTRITLLLVALSFLCGCQPSTGKPQQAAKQKERSNQTGVRIERLKETEAVLSRLGTHAWVFRLRGAPTNCEVNVFHRPVGADNEMLLKRFSGDQIIDLLQSGELPGKPASTDNYLIIAFPDPRLMQAEDEFTFSFSQGVSHTQFAKCKDLFPDVFFDATLNNESTTGNAGSTWTLQPGESAMLKAQTFWKTDRDNTERSGRVQIVVTATCLKDGMWSKR